MSDGLKITTASGHALAVGDVIEFPARPVRRWDRFVQWLRRPWRWPAREQPRTFVVSKIDSPSTFEIDNRCPRCGAAMSWHGGMGADALLCPHCDLGAA